MIKYLQFNFVLLHLLKLHIEKSCSDYALQVLIIVVSQIILISRMFLVYNCKGCRGLGYIQQIYEQKTLHSHRLNRQFMCLAK